MEMLTNFRFVENLANQLIHPRPCNYASADICKYVNLSPGKCIQNKELYMYKQTQLKITQERVMNLHLIENRKHMKKQTQKYQPSICIVYLHGLSSFSVQGVFLVQNLNKYFQNFDVSICLYDLRGHGKDKAQNITFGLKQSSQLYNLLQHLRSQRNFDQFVIWGRSMGATTILKMLIDYGKQLNQNNISIKYIVLDSAYQSFEKVALQMISKKTGMPKIFSKGIFQFLLTSIQKLYNLKLEVQIQKFTDQKIPALFLSSENDLMISPQHTKNIYEQYLGSKERVQIKVGHNTQRPDEILDKVFRKLVVCLQPQANLLIKRSISSKKIGLSVTKNKRVKTIESTLCQQDNETMNLSQLKKSQLKDSAKNIKNKLNVCLGPISPRGQKYYINCKSLMNKNSIKHSPKPFEISKQNQSCNTNEKLQNKQLKSSKLSPTFSIIFKQNQSIINQRKKNTDSKQKQKQKKINLSTKQLIRYKQDYVKQQRYRTLTNSISEKPKMRLETLKSEKQSQCSTAKNDCIQFKDVKSTFLINNEDMIENNWNCNFFKELEFREIGHFKKANYVQRPKSILNYTEDFGSRPYPSIALDSSKEQQMLQKKLSINQSLSSNPRYGAQVRPQNIQFQKANPKKPQGKGLSMDLNVHNEISQVSLNKPNYQHEPKKIVQTKLHSIFQSQVLGLQSCVGKINKKVPTPRPQPNKNTIYDHQINSYQQQRSMNNSNRKPMSANIHVLQRLNNQHYL